MINQILTTFVILGAVSIFLVSSQNLKCVGCYKEIKEDPQISLKMNVFKWISKEEYRISYLKKIYKKVEKNNEKL